MPLSFVRNDIVKMNTDAIVNAANSGLRAGSGVCGAIFAEAGMLELSKACHALGGCPVGGAVTTPGFRLRAKYVIHAVGPIWQGGSNGERELLYRAYQSALSEAEKHHCTSIAFPLISAGIYGYPKREALQVAEQAIQDYLTHSELEVWLVLFDRDVAILAREYTQRLRSFIDDRYVDEREHSKSYRRRMQAERPVWEGQLEEQSACCKGSAPSIPMSAVPQEEQEPVEDILQFFHKKPYDEAPCDAPSAAPKRSLADVVQQLDEPFSRMLFRLIDQRGLTDVEVYKRANLDRKLFSKLRNASYHPSKQTCIALAIALHLNEDELRDLLARAGYALSPSDLADVIITFFVQEGIYDIMTINEALFSYDQKLLGA